MLDNDKSHDSDLGFSEAHLNHTYSFYNADKTLLGIQVLIKTRVRLRAMLLKLLASLVDLNKSQRRRGF